MSNNKIIVYLTSTLLLFALLKCKSSIENDSSTTGTSIETNATDTIIWQCQNVENSNICIPNNWKIVKQHRVLYFATLNDDVVNTYLAIAKYKLTPKLRNERDYIQKAYQGLIADTSELFTGYTLLKFIFIDKESYYGEFTSTIRGKRYFSYSMIFIKNDYLYHILLKLPWRDSPFYRNIFKNILFKFKIDGSSIFFTEDEMMKIDTIDISKDIR